MNGPVSVHGMKRRAMTLAWPGDHRERVWDAECACGWFASEANLELLDEAIVEHWSEVYS